jgi:TIR domain
VDYAGVATFNGTPGIPVEAIMDNTLKLEWVDILRPENGLLAVANFAGLADIDLGALHPAFRMKESGWKPLIDTEDPNFGGLRKTPSPAQGTLVMNGPRFILFSRRVTKEARYGSDSIWDAFKGPERNQDGYDIFLSYCSLDEDRATRFCVAAKAAGVRVWRASDKVHASQDWEDRIREAIEKSRSLAALITTDGLRSDWVKTESAAGFWGKKPTWAVLTPGHEAKELPDLLKKFQAMRYEDAVPTVETE